MPGRARRGPRRREQDRRDAGAPRRDPRAGCARAGRFHLLSRTRAARRVTDARAHAAPEGEQVLAQALPLIEEAAGGPVDGAVSPRHDPMDAIEEALHDGELTRSSSRRSRSTSRAGSTPASRTASASRPPRDDRDRARALSPDRERGASSTRPTTCPRRSREWQGGVQSAGQIEERMRCVHDRPRELVPGRSSLRRSMHSWVGTLRSSSAKTQNTGIESLRRYGAGSKPPGPGPGPAQASARSSRSVGSGPCLRVLPTRRSRPP